ncbi:MAG: class I SAM-dependent methyltransferase [Candidatus Nanohaloarchaea archaeon]
MDKISELWAKSIETLREEGIVSLIRKIFNYFIIFPYRRWREHLKFLLWEKAGLLSLEMLYPQDYFESMTGDEQMEEANQFSAIFDELYHPESIIDFGCGTGRFLKYYYDRDREILGLEKALTAFEEAVVPRDNLKEHDLRKPYRAEKNFDLGICIEVIEHLPESSEEALLDTLTTNVDVLVLTAATPGQGGKHHVNEKPHEYWIKKVEKRGFSFMSEKTEKVKQQLDVENMTYLEENLMVFEKQDKRLSGS